MEWTKAFYKRDRGLDSTHLTKEFSFLPSIKEDGTRGSVVLARVLKKNLSRLIKEHGPYRKGYFRLAFLTIAPSRLNGYAVKAPEYVFEMAGIPLPIHGFWAFKTGYWAQWIPLIIPGIHLMATINGGHSSQCTLSGNLPWTLIDCRQYPQLLNDLRRFLEINRYVGFGGQK